VIPPLQIVADSRTVRDKNTQGVGLRNDVTISRVVQLTDTIKGPTAEYPIQSNQG
jgi:hypothetical protein